MARAGLFTCLALLACGEASAPKAFGVRLVDAAAWSGGDVALVSTAFIGALPRVRLGADTITVRRVDDSTVAASVPSDFAGATTLSVVLGVDSLPLGDVAIYGFTGIADGPSLSGFVLPIPGAPAPQFYANGATGLVRGDARFSTVTTFFPDSVQGPNCQIGPGPSFDPSHVVGTPPNGIGCGQPIVWQVTPNLLPLDTIPGIPGQTRLIAEIAPGKWLKTFITYAAAIESTDTVPIFRYYVGVGMSEIHQIRISPRGDRAAAVAIDKDIWVFGVTPFDTVFTVAATYRGSGAAFSASGDTLFVIGLDNLGAALLVAVNATTGAELARLRLATAPYALALDPVRPWIYVAEMQTCCTVLLEVVDLRTLGRVGLLAPPAGVGDRPAGEMSVLPSPSEPAVYVVLDGAFYPPASVRPVMRFAVKP